MDNGDNIRVTESMDTSVSIRTLLSSLGIIVLVGLFFIVVIYFSHRDTVSEEAFEEALNQAEFTPTVAPNNTNPIKQVLPTKNPIEKTNPFVNEYENPFE